MLIRSYLSIVTAYLIGSTLLNQMTYAQAAKNKQGNLRKTPTAKLTAAPTTKTKRSNVMVFISDDFRAIDLNGQSSNPITLPNIQALAAQGTQFTNAHTVFTVCGPSRNAYLTSIAYPQVVTFDQNLFDVSLKGLETYLGIIRRLGKYYVGEFGKNEHIWPQDLNKQLMLHMNQSDVPNLPASTGNSDCGSNIGCVLNQNKLTDTKVANNAINFLNAVAKKINKRQIENFLLVVGFHHSHIDWAVSSKNPKFYTMPLPNTTDVKVDLHGYPWPLNHKRCDELIGNKINKKPIFSGGIATADQITTNVLLWQTLRGMYFDGLAEVDSQIGRVINAANKLNLQDDLIVAFIGDHGWSNGERNLFCKGNLNEEDTNIPLVIKVPGITNGAKSHVPISNIDLAPTLLELALGQEVANNYAHPNGMQMQGKSFVSTLINPNAGANSLIFSRYGRCQNPTTEITSPCTSDTITGTCDRPPIVWMGHQAIGSVGNQTCTYLGWWPWHEVRRGCEMPTMVNQPASLNGFGVVSPQIDYQRSYTDFSMVPIQEQLTCYTTGNLYGQGDHPNTINLINQTKKYGSFIAAAKAQMASRYPRLSN
jgi:arylsulfatase A-like enzyme